MVRQSEEVDPRAGFAQAATVGSLIPPQPPSWRRRFTLSARIGAGLALLGLLIHLDLLSLSDVAAIIRDPMAIALVITLISANLAGVALRWGLLLRCQGVTVRFWRLLQIVYIGFFFGALLPGAASGDILRLVYGMRLAPGRGSATALSIVVDRFCGLWGLALFAGIAAVIWLPGLAGRPEFVALCTAVLIFVALMIVVTFVAFLMLGPLQRTAARYLWRRSDRLRTLVLGLIDAAVVYRRDVRTVAACCALSLAIHSLAIGGVIVVAMSLSIGSLTPLDYAFVTPLSMIANIVPLTPGGLGIGEGVFDQLSRLIEPVETGAAYATVFFVFRALSVAATLPGLPLFLMGVRKAESSASRKSVSSEPERTAPDAPELSR